MFVDASAIAAVLLAEEEAVRFRDLIESRRSFTSAIAVYEAALAIARVRVVPPEVGRLMVVEFLAELEVETLDIGFSDAEAALAAQARFGKGRHPARLNMGDCFAYAMARNRGLALLYKGDDFAQTDILGAH